VLWRGADHLRTGASGELLRWKKKELQVSILPFLKNKRLHRPFSCSALLAFVSFFPAGHGGEGEGGDAAVAAWMRKVHLLLLCANHMVDMIVAMIRGQEDRRSCRRFNDASSTSNSEALDGVLGRRFSPPSHQVVRPRLLVAGGRMRDSDEFVVGGEGSVFDCFSVFLAGSFLSISKDQFVFSFSQGPSCKMFPPTEII
jgi:hypothetical protein